VLRWGNWQRDEVPLGKLTSARSYNSRTKEVKATKTGATHEVPVHRTLAKVLASWKLTGWRQWMGRAPKPQDLHLARPRWRRVEGNPEEHHGAEEAGSP